MLLHAGVFVGAWPVAKPRPADVSSVIVVAGGFAASPMCDAFTVTASPASAVAQLTPDLVQSNLQALVERQQSRSVDEQFERLDTATRQLNRLTSDRSLDELSGHFRSWLRYGERATEPAPSVSGQFDEHTAQLHDVIRCAQPNGTWAYRGVLLDAAGRTLEVDLDEEQGRRAYELMQRVRANPLLEKVYRGIVMPLLDQLQQSDSSRRPVPAPSPPPNSEAKKRPAE